MRSHHLLEHSGVRHRALFQGRQLVLSLRELKYPGLFDSRDPVQLLLKRLHLLLELSHVGLRMVHIFLVVELLLLSVLL